MIAPIYDGSDKILTYSEDKIILKPTVQENDLGQTFLVLPITPRMLISALRSGITIKAIYCGSNGGDCGDAGTISYAGLFGFVDCEYATDTDYETGEEVGIFSAYTDGRLIFHTDNMDSYFRCLMTSGDK